MALRQRISKTNKRLVSSFLRVHVSEAYIAIGRINALYSRDLSFKGISRLFHIDVLSLPNADAAKDIRLLTSPDVVGNELPRNTKLSTWSTSLPSNIMGLFSGDMILHLAPLIFMPHFLQASSSCFVVRASLSNIADKSVVSSAYRISNERDSVRDRLCSTSLTSFITNSKKILNRVGERRHP